METRICKKCLIDKSLTNFAQAGKDPRYRRRVCNVCRDKAGYYANHEESKKKERLRRLRNPAMSMMTDIKKSDKKRGFQTDVTLDLIRSTLSTPCCYCGETTIRMTLDRIDNDKGHTMDNVVPACIRCNYTRKDMPYDAWLVVAKGMREAREQGLFGGWTCRVKSPLDGNDPAG